MAVTRLRAAIESDADLANLPPALRSFLLTEVRELEQERDKASQRWEAVLSKEAVFLAASQITGSGPKADSVLAIARSAVESACNYAEQELMEGDGNG